MLSKRS